MTTITVFHAGSLSDYLQKMARRFEKFKPHITVNLIGQGSRLGAKKILAGEKADIFISADIHSIRDLLMPEKASTAYIFAASELVLAYTQQSRLADKITAENWYDILANYEVSYGHTDPELDPAGYRTLFCWQLAELYYKKPGLYKKLKKEFSPNNRITRGEAINERIKNGTLDYFFYYKPSALLAGFPFLELPKEINLSEKKLANYYSQAHIKLSGKQPHIMLPLLGEPIQFTATLLNSASHPQEAEEFMAFIVNHGQTELTKDGFQPIYPAIKIKSVT